MSPPELTTVIHDDVCRALAEDIADGDITAALIPEQAISSATVISREEAILSGQAWFNDVFQQLDSRVQVNWQVSDGQAISANQTLCTLTGPSRALLSGERSALNFLQTLSATATCAHQYARAVEGTGAKILDTRKTIPGLRQAQKYAVTCGGCHNHRFGLFDAYLIKENHIAAAGSIANAVAQARQQHRDKPVEVEVEDLQQLQQALDAGCDTIMLDNMTLDQLSQAVTINNGRAKLEASGNVSLTTVRAIAETGVDYISTGELTKHIHAIDLSMRFND